MYARALRKACISRRKSSKSLMSEHEDSSIHCSNNNNNDSSNNDDDDDDVYGALHSPITGYRGSGGFRLKLSEYIKVCEVRLALMSDAIVSSRCVESRSSPRPSKQL